MPWDDFWRWTFQVLILAVLIGVLSAAVVGIIQAERDKRKKDD